MERERQPHYDIREATVDDVEAIRAMQAQSWRDTYRNDELGVTERWLAEETAKWLTPERMAKSYEKLSEVFSDPQQFYRVAYRDKEVVGLIHASTKPDNTTRLEGLYTAKQTHGTGLAWQLMSLVDQWVEGSDTDLEVVSYNERAKAFYRKCGFVEAGEADELFRGKMPVTIMVRRAEHEA